jgi:glutathione synthase/RimK-type ligase-like ATP-grasp enzyme
MKLYLDEDTARNQLLRALRRAGHDVQTAVQIGLAGESDPVQLMTAIQEERSTLTHNYCDFEDLHNLVDVAQGHHPGIIVIRRDNDKRRNMAPHDIIRALRNLEAAGVPVADQCIILNQWQ